MKLNLGSNTVRYNGYLNVDIRDIGGVDIVDDVFSLESIADNSVESIKAHNILEHIAPDRTLTCVARWVSKLIKGGDIEISVPDGELIFNRYLNHQCTRQEYSDHPWEDVIHSIFGNMPLLRQWHGENAEKYMHHTLFSNKYLKYIMKKAGISGIINRATSIHPDNLTLEGTK